MTHDPSTAARLHLDWCALVLEADASPPGDTAWIAGLAEHDNQELRLILLAAVLTTTQLIQLGDRVDGPPRQLLAELRQKYREELEETKP